MVMRYASTIGSTTWPVERGVIPGCQDVRWCGTAERGIGEYVRIKSASFIVSVVIFRLVIDWFSYF